MINILASSKVRIIVLNEFPGLQKNTPLQKTKQMLSNGYFKKIKEKTTVRKFLESNQSIQDTLKRSDCNWTRTQNQLILKRTLNHLAKRAKWLSVRLRT